MRGLASQDHQIGLLGFALSPTISGQSLPSSDPMTTWAPAAGITAHYWSWRAVHYSLAAFGCGALVCIFLFFPETSHPNSRGIDEYNKTGKPLPKWRPVILNPLSQLLMLRSPILLFMVWCITLCCPQFSLTGISSPSSHFLLSWPTSVGVSPTLDPNLPPDSNSSIDSPSRLYHCAFSTDSSSSRAFFRYEYS